MTWAPWQPVGAAHGRLHVGPVLRVETRYVGTDFDGNPVPATADRTAAVHRTPGVATMRRLGDPVEAALKGAPEQVRQSCAGCPGVAVAI